MPSAPYHWERGYRCHGLWSGNVRVGRVGIGPRKFWKRGRDPYLWETDFAPILSGESISLNAAKRAVEKALGVVAVTTTDPK